MPLLPIYLSLRRGLLRGYRRQEHHIPSYLAFTFVKNDVSGKVHHQVPFHSLNLAQLPGGETDTPYLPAHDGNLVLGRAFATAFYGVALDAKYWFSVSRPRRPGMIVSIKNLVNRAPTTTIEGTQDSWEGTWASLLDSSPPVLLATVLKQTHQTLLVIPGLLSTGAKIGIGIGCGVCCYCNHWDNTAVFVFAAATACFRTPRHPKNISALVSSARCTLEIAR